MFAKEDCSYNTYRKILEDIKSSGKFCDYADVIKEKKNQFLVLRHDIEFSVERAFRLAEVETEAGICSTYFVQITNNAYNPFSRECKKMLYSMKEQGHYIGLHYHRDTIDDIEPLKNDIIRQADIFEKMLGIKVDRFSFHRPLSEHLKADIRIPGMINAYGHEFFSYMEHPNDAVDVKYIADSNHQWKYGYANKEYFSRYDKIQLLIHPLSWSEHGADHVQNFKDIVQEKHDVFVETIEHEWKIFDELRGKI